MATEYFNDAWRIPNNKNQSLVSNYSMDFDGTSSLVNIDTINSSISSSAKGSVSCWVKWDGSNALRSVGFGSNSVDRQYIVIQINPDGKAYAQYKTSSITGWQLRTTSSITANVWTHFVVVQNGTSPIIYINGSVPSQSFVEATNKTRWWPNLNSFNTSTIGALRWNSSGTLAFSYGTGKIDQVSIFDYALSATGTNSVATLYGGGTAVTNPMGLSPKPVAYYQLGDQTASNNTTEPNPPVQSYLVPNNSLQDYVFFYPNNIARISVPSRTNSSTATISLWVNYDSLGTGGAANVVIGGGTTTYWPYLQNTSGKFHFYINTPSSPSQNVVTTVDVVLNKWFHIALSDDGTNTKAYINGVPQGTMTSAASAVFDTIGAYSNGGFSTDGRMSNVAYWQNTNLSDAQILSIYNNGAPNDISSLSPTSWYKLNAQDTFDGSNWTIKDSAGSSDGESLYMYTDNLVQSNLQHTNGFSPYALDFSGITASLKTYTIPAQTNTVTLSAWVKRTGTAGTSAGVFGVRNGGATGNFGVCWDLAFLTTTNKIEFRIADTTYRTVNQNDVMPDNTWTHVAGVADGTNIKLYINSVLQTDTDTYSSNLLTPTSNIFFAAQGPAGGNPFNGQLSNCARWNVGLTQAQVTEIYNQGVPSNLNTFSGTAPIGWWQLGSNSSFEGNDWTCLDEIGTDYADSHSTAMTEDDIVNGPGYSGNGLGTSSIEIVGDAPYSTANGISENMDVLDRTTDVPPTV